MGNLEHFSEFKMAAAAIMDVGEFSTFELDDLEGHVIPLFRGLRGWGVHFWSYFLDIEPKSRSYQRSNVKFHLKLGKSPLFYVSF